MKASLRRLIVVGSLCVLCMLMVWLVGRRLAPEPAFVFEHPGKFDRGEWLELGKSEHLISERQAVLADLMANHLELGMTAFDVFHVVGPADRFSGANNEVWHYNINCESTPEGNMNYDNLELRFDPNWALFSMETVVQ